MGKSVIKLPNGTIIEIAVDTPPEQITAMINALNNNAVIPIEEKTKGKIIEYSLTPEEIWNSSNTAKLALFIRNFINEQMWFNASFIMKQQINELDDFIIEDIKKIRVYLSRLHESGYFDLRKKMKKNEYRITEKLINEYPEIIVNREEIFQNLLSTQINQ